MITAAYDMQQRKLIEIAKCLNKNPEIFIVDETTLSPDSKVTQDNLFLDIKKIHFSKDYESYSNLINDLRSEYIELKNINEENDILLVTDLYNKIVNLKENFDDIELANLKQEQINISNIIFSISCNISYIS